MCADSAIPADYHAASNHGARPDTATRADLCSGLNHTLRPDFGGRINPCTLGHNCRGVHTGSDRRDRMEQRCDLGPANVWFGGENGHRRGWHPCLHVGMHNYGTGQRLLECGRKMPVVQKTHLIRAGHLQGRNTFED